MVLKGPTPLIVLTDTSFFMTFFLGSLSSLPAPMLVSIPLYDARKNCRSATRPNSSSGTLSIGLLSFSGVSL
jgi:hypothetical protein